MGTVGLSFGSATSGKGFDVATTVTSILAIEQGIETPWKTQLTKLAAQDAALTSLGTDLATLTTRLQALTDFDGVLAGKEGSSSDTGTLALTSATSKAVAGSHDIVVSRLAQTASSYSDAVASTDALSGSLSIQVGSGTAQTITLDSSNNTLATLVKAINSGSYGVHASVLTDSSGSRLSLVSSTSGAAGALTLASSLQDTTTSATVALNTAHAGTDASLTVDGVALTSSSNTVTNAITGVTFQLLNTSSNPVQVEITNDTSSISTAMSALVTAYNAVIKDLNTQEGKDSSGNAEPLYGDATIALVQQQLGSALIGGAGTGSIKSLTQLGISANNDGTLTLDSGTLSTALTNSFGDIEKFLQDSGNFGSNFNSVLNGLSSGASHGAVYLALQQNSTAETSLNKNVSDEEARVAAHKVTLTKELTLANEILQAIPTQLSEIDEIYSAVTGYKGS